LASVRYRAEPERCTAQNYDVTTQQKRRHKKSQQRSKRCFTWWFRWGGGTLGWRWRCLAWAWWQDAVQSLKPGVFKELMELMW
jgi:hypothetical protein